jgi:hypothetical protein
MDPDLANFNRSDKVGEGGPEEKKIIFTDENIGS